MAGNSFGQLFKITTFGESHGPAIGVVIDGVPPKLPLVESDIQKDLDRRKPGQSKITTQRKEADRAAGEFQEDLGANAPESGCPLLPTLRSPLHLRHTAECGRCRGRVGDATSPADGRQGVQEILADETPDEARSADQDQPQGQRGCSDPF